MPVREVLEPIKDRAEALRAAAQELDQFVNALISEADRSASRIRELAGEPNPLANAGSGKRRGRPPKNAQLEAPLDAGTLAPAVLSDRGMGTPGQ